jgi:predicted RNA-binding protein with TRAM domain
LREHKSKHNKSVQTFDVAIEKIVPGGYGLAFAENLTIFVSLAAIGDKLRVRVREKREKSLLPRSSKFLSLPKIAKRRRARISVAAAAAISSR